MAKKRLQQIQLVLGAGTAPYTGPCGCFPIPPGVFSEPRWRGSIPPEGLQTPQSVGICLSIKQRHKNQAGVGRKALVLRPAAR